MRPAISDIVHAATALSAVVALLLWIPGPPALAAQPFQPEVGQVGKDVIWVPTPERAVARMLALAQVGPTDCLIDLGSGDGRIVIAAALHHGARGFGVDLNPDMVRLSEYRARQAGVAERARFFVRDIFHTDLRRASVVTLYLLPELNRRLRPQLLALAPGTRIVAHAFDMGEWEADQLDTATASLIRMWIVPAPVSGRWSWSVRLNGLQRQFELDMNQQFQRISGVVSVGRQRLRLRDPTLRGDALSFVLLEEPRADHGVRYDYAGRVKGDAIEGVVTSSDGDKRIRWMATRRPIAASAARSGEGGETCGIDGQDRGLKGHHMAYDRGKPSEPIKVR